MCIVGFDACFSNYGEIWMKKTAASKICASNASLTVSFAWK